MKPMILAIAVMLILSLAVLRAAPSQGGQDDSGPKEFEAFTLADLVERAEEGKDPYLPFLERSTLSTGLYRLKAGSRDGQGAHGLDEVYYIIEGQATVLAGDDERKVIPGDVVFVAAGVEHRFINIETDLTVLVFFTKKLADSDKKD
jgi:mannose-6-phosphate isomerase-like protein (cupin superfamily)